MPQLINAVSVVSVVLCYSRHVLSMDDQPIVFRDLDNPEAIISDRFGDLSCKTLNGGVGKCISILECPKLLALVSRSDQKEFLKKSHCGWKQTVPKVCCGEDATTIASTTEPNCTGWDMQWCAHGQGDNECCTPELTYNIVDESTTADAPLTASGHRCELSLRPPEPTSGCCGRGTINYRVIPGDTAEIDQYPWSAIIEYKATKTNETQPLCGGALISGRYVLTAAHCLHIDSWNPVSVRLGDYDVDNRGVDCMMSDGGGADCTEGATTIPIAGIIPHEEYRTRSRVQTNDIALVRLRDVAPYTDFIRPICLPSATEEFDATADTKTRLYIAGWGLALHSEYRSPLKRQFELSYVPNEICYPPYWRMDIKLDDGHLCADRVKRRDSCKGDSGGPLMLVRNGVTEIVGVSCFSSCGKTRRAEVFTNVQHHMQWIRSNMEMLN